mmetsp:Transcript_5568/g.13567  ORF Transcript_5568/g.13567 Transcript_5568/m.13567 type:complete len:153 (-) Transcript_5568:733-1191(-)
MVESMVEAKQSWSRHYPLCANLLTSGVSVSTASLCTNPLDVLKVRLQLQQRRCARSHGLVRLFLTRMSRPCVAVQRTPNQQNKINAASFLDVSWCHSRPQLSGRSCSRKGFLGSGEELRHQLRADSSMGVKLARLMRQPLRSETSLFPGKDR